MAEYVVDAETGCWIWQKGTRSGYGRLRRQGKLHSAHRWYWEQAHGPVPDGVDLDHTCHNADAECPGGFDCRHRRCVNPDHMTPANRAANVQRGRLAKLTPQQVAEIRAQPHTSRQVLATHYGVSVFNVAMIRAGRTWKDVLPAEGTVA